MEENPQSTEQPISVEADENRAVCGIIMPISATSNFKADHWRSVNILLHRCILASGFQPKNVWENAGTDRVSERIIGNIYTAAIVVADITDLNPNVMLEVGLRLASKKPTIVIVARDSVIPFDLRDFHAVVYPPNLNIIEMENFFSELSSVIKAKFNSFLSDEYVPFLGNIIVDVLAPEQREVGTDELVLKRLAEMASAVSRLEDRLSPRAVATSPHRRSPIINSEGTFTVIVSHEKFSDFRDAVDQLFEVDEIIESGRLADEVRARVRYSGCNDVEEFSETISDLLQEHGGRLRVASISPAGGVRASVRR